jgi:hypothetical protein
MPGPEPGRPARVEQGRSGANRSPAGRCLSQPRQLDRKRNCAGRCGLVCGDGHRCLHPWARRGTLGCSRRRTTCHLPPHAPDRILDQQRHEWSSVTELRRPSFLGFFILSPTSLRVFFRNMAPHLRTLHSRHHRTAVVPLIRHQFQTWAYCNTENAGPSVGFQQRSPTLGIYSWHLLYEAANC